MKISLRRKGRAGSPSTPHIDLNGGQRSARPTLAARSEIAPYQPEPSVQSETEGGFTMIEIALCLAVIGFALVAIIGVLPIGMSVQKENREDTVINFDANYLMDAIRSGSQGLDSLTNYVNSITTVNTLCHDDGTTVPGYTYTNNFTTNSYSIGQTGKQGGAVLTSGAIIVGLLSTPKYVPDSAPKTPGDYWSNTVIAEFRAITGSATDQGAGSSSQDFAFKYRVYVENVPSGSFPYYGGTTPNFSAPGQLATNANTNPAQNGWQTAVNLQANLHEIRLRFRWPLLPGGQLGNGDRTFRSSVAGQVQSYNLASVGLPPALATNIAPPGPLNYYYFLQPLSFNLPLTQ